MYVFGLLDESNFKQAVVKGLVIVNVANLSAVTSTSICQSLSATLSKSDCILLCGPGVCAALGVAAAQLSVPFYGW